MLVTWSGHRECEAAERGGVGDQLDRPDAGYRRGDGARTVVGESAGLVGAGAARLVELQVDQAAGAAVGEVELRDLERDVLVRSGGEGVLDLPTGRRNGDLHRLPAGEPASGHGTRLRSDWNQDHKRRNDSQAR